MIAVTGASGFIGTRLCEHLRLGLGVPVRAVVHRPERAVRLARLDVELTTDLRRLDGADAVVHLAYATSGTRRERARATEALARTVAEATGERRLVHVSTAAVWGFDAKGVVDESVPTRRTGHPYVDGKIAAEEAVRAGCPNHVVLRPTNVWGPWGPAFTVAPVTALRDGRVALVGDGAAPANLVYVDNLVHAVLRALEAPTGTYVVNDGDEPPWRALYDAYAAIGGWTVRTAPVEALAGPGRLREAAANLAAHPAARVVGRRVLGRARRRVSGAFANSPEFPSPELAALQTSGVRYDTTLARRVLGYEPRVTFEQGLRLTEEWLRFAQLV